MNVYDGAHRETASRRARNGGGMSFRLRGGDLELDGLDRLQLEVVNDLNVGAVE